MALASAKFERFIEERLRTGRYQSKEQVLQAAQEALINAEAEDDLDVEYVRQAIAEAERDGIYKGDVFADIRAKLGLPAQA